jgi:ligand-binding SRPBCC domain-containing protein
MQILFAASGRSASKFSSMYRIYLETRIKSTQHRCFELSRSIDFHKDSMNESREVPVAGKMSGLIELGEFVEWEATHFYVRQRLSSKITEMVKPHYFVDEMVKGAFKSFSHKHEIRELNENEVVMIDDFRYETPLGILGRIAYSLFLKKYMENMIMERGLAIKHALETDEWKKYVSE